MKSHLLIIKLCFLLFAPSIWAEPIQPDGKVAPHVTVEIKGMVCSFCAQGLEKKFAKLKEIALFSVDLKTKQIQLWFQPNRSMSEKQLTELVLASGYNVGKFHWRSTKKMNQSPSHSKAVDPL